MSSDQPYQGPPSPPPTQTRGPRQHQRSISEASSSGGRPPTDSRTGAFPFAFIRPLQANLSSTSLVSSTAEGKPIPVDNSTVQHRTSALRELNHNFPSRHRYEKSTGAQSSTYSEPVIVRSYYSPVPNRPANAVHGSSAATASHRGGSTTSERSSLPFSSTIASARTGMLSRMVRARESNLATDAQVDTKLPPVEAFSFKNFIANIEPQEGRTDINADLDRIAEICAKSRYSLSNQYEVHYAPHGSGSSFLDGPSHGQENQGPTLQAVPADEEQSMKRNRRRRHGPRPNSRAMGTLETIMSSSRSSEDERTKKKSAAELADEVRGRSTRRESETTSPTGSMHSGPVAENPHGQDQEPPRDRLRRKSVSLALIDVTSQNQTASEQPSPRNSTQALVGEPALPQATTSQLELRTFPEEVYPPSDSQSNVSPRGLAQYGLGQPVAKGAVSYTDQDTGLLSSLSNWVPWKSTDSPKNSWGRAEGSLRDLLRDKDRKGKGVESSM